MPSLVEEHLVESYRYSSRRIMEALAGRFTPSNRMRGGDPPERRGQVVGMCSQGGRHISFEVPLRALREAAEAILALSASRGNRPIRDLRAICARLRRRTRFDTNSGCVNDRVPGLVPFLPPEEVFCDGQELPLDVWRLLSFELDLASSALSSSVNVTDISFGALNQQALLFASLIQRAADRRTEFHVEFRNLPSEMLFPDKDLVSCSLARLFFEAGCLLTPLSASDDFARWYLAMRYINWISSSARHLTILDVFSKSEVDARYKALFSEEMAIAMMAVVLRDRFQADLIMNTAEMDPAGRSPRGLRADFVATGSDSSGNIIEIVAESKGSLGRPVSAARIAHGKAQAASTRPYPSVSQVLIPLVSAGSLYYEKQNAQSICIIDDPEQDDSLEPFEFDPVTAWRVAFAKFFQFVGLEDAASEVAHGEHARTLEIITEDIGFHDDERGPTNDTRALRRSACDVLRLKPILNVGQATVVIDSKVISLLFEGIDEETSHMLHGILRDNYRHRQQIWSKTDFGETERLSFINPNGIGLLYDRELERIRAE